MNVIKLDDLLSKQPAKEPENVSELLDALTECRDKIDSLHRDIVESEQRAQEARGRAINLRRTLARERRNFSKFAGLFVQKFNESQIPAQYTGARFFYDGQEISDVLEYSADPDDENAPQMISGVLKNGDPITIAADDEKLEIIKE